MFGGLFFVPYFLKKESPHRNSEGFVAPKGIKPLSQAPETCILFIELRSQFPFRQKCGFLSDYSATFCAMFRSHDSK